MSKDSHSFSVSVAQKVGVPGAILIQHFAFLQKANISGNENWQEKWVKRSAKSMAKTYPYWTAKVISTICDRLEKDEYLFSKIENALKTDRAKSFLLTQKGLLLIGEIPFSQMENGFSDMSNANTETENDILPNGEMNIEVDCTSFIPSFVEEKAAALSSTSEPENQTLEAKEKKEIPPNSAAPPLTGPFTPTGETIEPKPATIVRLYTPGLENVTVIDSVPGTYETKQDPRTNPPAEFRRVNIGEEIERLKTDPAAKETFALVRKIPSSLFPDYVEAFEKEIGGTGETYHTLPAFRKHFFNWCGIRWEIAQRKATGTKQNRSTIQTFRGTDYGNEKQAF